jgi:hypothetical protein
MDKTYNKTGVLLDGFTVQDGYYSGGRGGGIYTEGVSSMSIRNCVISDNYADYGGGIGNGSGMFTLSMQIANSVLANNTAVVGGAFYNNFLTEIVNCTIAGNSADSVGGGIVNGGPTIIENSIIWGNLAGAGPENIYNYNNALPMISYSDVEGSIFEEVWQSYFGNDLGGNIASDPQFVNSEDFDGVDGKLGTADDGLRLNGESPNISPCIDAGNNLFIHEVNDIAGNKRKFDGNGDLVKTVDMGAYEYVLHCGDIFIIDVEYDQTSIKDPGSYGWQDESFSCDPMTFSATFRVENSYNCIGQGGNSATQSGTCDIWIYLPSAKAVTLSVEGNVETVDMNKDVGEIYLDEATSPEVRIEGHDGGNDCTMVPEDDDATITLGSGIHHIQFYADTMDGLYHVGAYFTFTVTIQNP